jgi:hypothetical protein
MAVCFFLFSKVVFEFNDELTAVSGFWDTTCWAKNWFIVTAESNQKCIEWGKCFMFRSVHSYDLLAKKAAEMTAGSAWQPVWLAM